MRYPIVHPPEEMEERERRATTTELCGDNSPMAVSEAERSASESEKSAGSEKAMSDSEVTRLV